MTLSFYGMRRSGNHAILEWLCHSLGDGTERNMIENNRLIQYGDAYYLNEVNTMMRKLQPRLDKIKDAKWTIFAYEDEPTTFKHKLDKSDKTLVIVRDIHNLMASRHQKVLRDKRSFDMRMDDKFFNTWLEHANQPDENIIYYEKWLVDRRYRDSILERLGARNLDNTSTVNTAGGGSSFVGVNLDTTQNLLNRWQQVELDEKLINRLEDDAIKKARKRLKAL